jgi:putative serine/threonine protein kinase
MRFEEFKKLKKLEKFAEGYRGIIYTYTENGQKFAVKVPSEKKLIKTFQKEAQILEYLNRLGFSFVPRLTLKGEDFFVYRFIEGTPFKKIQKEIPQNVFKYFLRKLLLAAYCLDKVGVFKDEFQRPFTNVLINGKRLYLIDFERGLLNKHWKNVPQFLQFLVAVGVLDRDTAIRLGREYKKNPKKVVKSLLRNLI